MTQISAPHHDYHLVDLHLNLRKERAARHMHLASPHTTGLYQSWSDQHIYSKRITSTESSKRSSLKIKTSQFLIHPNLTRLSKVSLWSWTAKHIFGKQSSGFVFRDDGDAWALKLVFVVEPYTSCDTRTPPSPRLTSGLSTRSFTEDLVAKIPSLIQQQHYYDTDNKLCFKFSIVRNKCLTLSIQPCKQTREYFWDCYAFFYWSHVTTVNTRFYTQHLPSATQIWESQWVCSTINQKYTFICIQMHVGQICMKNLANLIGESLYSQHFSKQALWQLGNMFIWNWNNT